MAHNPILKHLNLGRFDRFTVEKGTVAVLIKNQRIERIADPGERIGNTQADIVDASPQVLVWRAELPSSHQNDFFSCTLTLRYAVSDPARMVKDVVSDTEALLTRVLEQRLRTLTRKTPLNHHAGLETEVEELWPALPLHDVCGLEFLEQPDVVFTFSEQAKARIKELDRQERAVRLPQTARHDDDLPSSEPAVRFRVHVDVQYRVSNLADLPYDTLAEAEQQLWPRLQRVLRRAGRQYKVTDIAQAEVAMQDAVDAQLDEGGVKGFGVEILAVEVATDLDEAARKRYVELAMIEHETAIQRARLDGLEKNTAFYTGLIEKGSWAVLAVAVSKNEVSLEDLYRRMSQAEQQKLQMQFDLLKSLRQDNLRDESQDYEISKVLMHSVTSQVVGTQGLGVASASPVAGQIEGGAEGGNA